MRGRTIQGRNENRKKNQYGVDPSRKQRDIVYVKIALVNAVREVYGNDLRGIPAL